MKKSLFNKLLIPIAASLVLYILILVWSDLEELKKAFSNFKLYWLPAVFILAFTNYLLRYVKFHYYLKILNIKIKPTLGFLVFLASFVMAITPGKLGEVLKSVYLKDLTGAPKSRTAPIVLAERITDLLAFIFLALFGISGFTQRTDLLLLIFALLIAVLIFCALIGYRSLMLKCIKVSGKIQFFERYTQRIETMYESICILITPVRLFWAVLISIPSWSCEVFAFYLIFVALGQSIPIEACFFIYSAGTLIGAISFLPGGLGATEVIMLSLLQLLSIPKAIASSATILIRLCTLWFAVLLGGVVIFAFRKQLGGTHTLEELE